MRFETQVALKYLFPKWKKPFSTIISLVSILVIALVVWLILVFFSVTNGLEQRWTETLVAINAPVKLTPTKEYYNSYYYLIDGISENSDYMYKTIDDKLQSKATDPYNPEIDEEIPFYWPNNESQDIVKETFQLINDIPNIKATDYERALSNLKLDVVRPFEKFLLTQNSVITSFDENNKKLQKTFLEPSPRDIENLLFMSQIPLAQILKNVKITDLKTPAEGWIIPRHLLPDRGHIQAIELDNKIIIPTKKSKQTKKLNLSEMPKNKIVLLAGNTLLPVELKKHSVSFFRELLFNLKLKIQGITINGEITFGYLNIGKVIPKINFNTIPANPPPWLYYIGPQKTAQLPSNDNSIIVPKSFLDSGALLGDRGSLSYHSTTATSIQEQLSAVYIAGFYNPGIVPIGNKLIMASKDTTSTLLSSLDQQTDILSLGNGIHVWFDKFNRADTIKEQIEQKLHEKGLSKYWKVESFREYDFAKNFLQQLSSDKMLFTLIAIIIILVACSNIISMLILLVNDKRKEIGILQAMGATKKSITIIFGICGAFIGTIASLFGIFLATITLQNLNFLVSLLSKIQDRPAFDESIYGKALPNALSYEALIFVIVATIVLAIIAGLIPAIKASCIRTSKILRSQ